MFEGLPDFGTCQPIEGVPTFSGFGAASTARLFVLPAGVAVARHADGSPAFALTLLRWADLSGGSGVLDVGLALTYPPLPAGVGGWAHAPAAQGWLSLSALPSSADQPLVSNAVSATDSDALRCLASLPLQAAQLLAASLTEGTVQLVGGLDLVVDGVAARAPASVSFDPVAMLEVLHQCAPSGVLEWSALTGTLAADPPITVESSDAAPDLLRAALADRLIARFTRPRPAAGDCAFGYVLDGTDVQPGLISWDLAAPAATSRLVRLSFDPLAALRQGPMPVELETLVTERTVPTLDLGHATLDVLGNLPPNRANVVELGATLTLPVRPPDRLQVQRVDVPLVEPDDRGAASFQLGPGGELAYTRSTYVVLGPVGTLLRGAEAPDDRTTCVVTADDLPVRLASVSVSPAMSALGEVLVDTVLGTASEASVPQQTVTAERPTVTVAVPRDTEAVLAFVLRDPGSGLTLDLGSRQFGDTRLDPAAIPGLTSRTLHLEALVPAGSVTAVEVRPDDEASPTPPSTLFFTSDVTARDWSYVTPSPFRTGYRHREYRQQGPELPWSAPCDPAQVLRVPGGEAEAPS